MKSATKAASLSWNTIFSNLHECFVKTVFLVMREGVNTVDVNP